MLNRLPKSVQPNVKADLHDTADNVSTDVRFRDGIKVRDDAPAQTDLVAA